MVTPDASAASRPEPFTGQPPILPSGATLPRVIAVDIDGTLLGPEKVVTARTRAAIDAVRSLGAHVVVATGRPLRTALPVAEQIAATSTIVAYNGAAIWHAQRFQLLRALDLGVAQAAVERLRAAAPGATLALETSRGWYLDAELPAGDPGNAAHLFRGGPPVAIGPLEGFMDGGPIKLLAVYDDAHPSALAESLNDLELYTTWSLPFLLEVHHPLVNKGAALAHLCEEWQVEPSEVAAFGDQHNDSAMLAWAGLGVAMGNSEPEALAAADLVTASNLEDGVALVLESWVRASAEAAV